MYTAQVLPIARGHLDSSIQSRRRWIRITAPCGCTCLTLVPTQFAASHPLEVRVRVSFSLSKTHPSIYRLEFDTHITSVERCSHAFDHLKVLILQEGKEGRGKQVLLIVAGPLVSTDRLAWQWIRSAVLFLWPIATLTLCAGCQRAEARVDMAIGHESC